MSIQDEMRDDLDTDVFAVLGKTVTLINETSPIYNDRGELEGQTSASTSILAVPYNIVENRQSHQSFGEMQEGDMDMAVRYDQVINIDDLVLIESIYYKVKQIEKNFLPGNVVTIVRLAKSEPLESDD